MAKTITDKAKQETVKFLEATVVPRISKMVEEVNKTLGDKKIRVGLELNWFMDDTSDEEQAT